MKRFIGEICVQDRDLAIDIARGLETSSEPYEVVLEEGSLNVCLKVYKHEYL